IVDTDTKPERFQKLLEEHFQGDLRRMVTLYFDASMRMVEMGGFDFVGHADKISYNAGLCDPTITDQVWFQKRLRDYFALIAEKGLMMEINTKAYLSKGCFFPHIRYFRLLKELNIPVLVNSDAHLPELVNASRNEALQFLKDAGFETVRELHQGVWKEVEIG
ncbi:MAG: histidinol-phosphatase, partial [Odoribacter sp.]